MYLFFDTETTDKRPGRARLVQLAAVLSYPDGREAMSLNAMIKCGVPIPAETSAIHGITDEMSQQLGMPEGDALVVFEHMVRCAQLLIGHNISYDIGVMEAAFKLMDGAGADPFKGKQSFCTKDNTVNICRLPKNTGHSGFKWPSLKEAYFHFFQEDFDGAHNALADVHACRDVFFAVLDLKKAQRQAEEDAQGAAT
jgi:DNA polymerase-3 subunit epsilon